ncbi:DUF1772 domain-containing protein [Naumannella halotolerans]|uniref:anthrone oxygenase family protein n=1 Tax=Naumannella halotolerans TaxID=993414 RepID=UPI00370D1921
MFRTLLCTAGALLSAVTAAVYLNFSVRVMPELGRLAPATGIARMQGFNRAAVQAPFMICFFGAAVASAILLLRVLRGDRDAIDAVAALGGVAYLAGFLLTIAYDVPLDDRLATLERGSGGDAFWRHYLTHWTRSNSIRAGLSAVSALALSAATLLGATGD